MKRQRSLFLMVLVGMITGCAGLSVEELYQSPSFSHQNTRLTGLTWTSLSGRSTVELNNPNPFSVPVSQLQAELWLEGEPWLDLGTPQLDGLAAEATTALDFDWEMTVPGLMDRARKAYQAGAAELELRLTSSLDVPVLGARQIDWQHSFTMPVPKSPRVALTDWQVDSLSMSEVTLSLNLAVSNPNRFNLLAGPWGIDVLASQRQLSSLSLQQIELPAGETRQHRTRVSLDFADLGPSLINALRSGDWPRNLSLDWNGRMASPDLGLKLPALEGQVAL